MAESFSRWESDPLFCAAEVVQDSADRMESVYRSLLHEQKLALDDPSDGKLFSSLQSHRRDLTTALETTRWQLEDFEREVNFAALSDESKSREIAILKHKQFIRAIREQILQVEKSVQDSSKEYPRSYPQWTNLDEQDKDMLTSFLSGSNLRDHSSNYNTGSKIMRSIDSDTDTNDIVELKLDKVEALPMNGTKNMNIIHGSLRQQELEKPATYDLEFGGLGVKKYSYQNLITGSTWGFLRNFWPGNDSKDSFTKRRKDGEITGIIEDVDKRIASSSSLASQDQQAFRGSG
ncbi:uncharacterized protein LOC109838022 isoform X2 [Asparagus officinalis]|uniref:uncharacterized protein LOC109838022 isoform X2 n=1 Tax=Asparagus officinalis TaxID=4686 RepID=UPI00098E09C9|nr:uncharacterized protein LOC109838022 isoform X2 [Asparagus officinalis]